MSEPRETAVGAADVDKSYFESSEDRIHYDLLTQVASLYYEREMTQAEIGEALGLSRVKVYRLLKEAKDKGAVQIVVNWRIERVGSLERAITEFFSLRDAVIVRKPLDPGYPLLRCLGQAVTTYLEPYLSGKGKTTMAVCVGRSTFEVINAIAVNRKANVRVVEAIGSIPAAPRELDGTELVRGLAEKLGGQATYLTSPLFADDAEAAAVLRRQQGIDRTLAAARAADLALVGIGNLDPAVSTFVRAGFATPEELNALAGEGAVGDIAGRVFTLSGELHSCDFNKRIIGITLNELRQIPHTVAVAAGIAKSNAILGALRTGAVDTLATDEETAVEVLRLAQRHESATDGKSSATDGA